MSYGFEIRGDAGNIMVDDTYPVFQVIEQGVIPPSASTYSYLHRVKFTRTYADPPLLILYPPDGRAGLLYTFRFTVNSAGQVDGFSAELSGSPFRLLGYSDPDPLVGGSAVALIEPSERAFGWSYAVATDQIPYGEEPYGVRVWDTAGRLVYDSAWPLAYFRAPLSTSLVRTERELVGDVGVYETYRDTYEAPVAFSAGARVGILASTWANKSGNFDFGLAFGFASAARDKVSVLIKWTKHASPGLDWALRFMSQTPVLAAI